MPNTPTTYTPGTQWSVYQVACCAVCGQLPGSHHTDGRCYTIDELRHRLAFHRDMGRWPGPDEGCEETPHA